jgi:glucose-6-phosphate isomerase
VIHDLSSISGLAMALDERLGLIEYGPGLAPVRPVARQLGQLRDVLATDDVGSDDRPCYWMYRDVRRVSDEPALARLGIRYDVTVTLPGIIGGEFMKTAGHYHGFMPGGVSTYPEIYEVLSGDGLILLQRVTDPTASLDKVVVEDVLLVRVRSGDRLLIPSHHGHVTINLGSKPLVVADLIATACQNHYGAIRDARGAAYYVVATVDGYRLQPNPRYGRLPTARVCETPADAGLNVPGPPMYGALLGEPERFAFLTEYDSPR